MIPSDRDACYSADDLLIRQEMQVRQIRSDVREGKMVSEGLLHAFIDAFVALVDPGGVV